MYGLGVNKLGVNNTADPIAKLFADGSEGAWYDPSDLSTLFQEDGTTPAGVNDPVGKILDKSGNGNHMVQTTLTKCPILRRDNDLYYLDFDGADDGLQTFTTIDFSGTDAVSVFAGARKTVNDANQNVVELSNSVGSNNGAFRLFYVLNNVWRSIMKGTVANTISTATVTSELNKSIFSVTADISEPSHSLRRNGSVVESNTNSLGTGNFGNYLMNMGSRSDGASSVLNGDVYGLVVLSRKATDNETAAVESYMARKSGVSI
jgi:hypothetical protein